MLPDNTSTQGIEQAILAVAAALAAGNPSFSSNPYKFNANRNAALNSSAAANLIIIFDLENFDTGSNYSTSNGKFVAPVDGYYQFNANVALASASTTIFILFLYTDNGATMLARGSDMRFTGTNKAGMVAWFGFLNAGQEVHVELYTNAAVALDVAAAANNGFSGFLVSRQ